MNKNLFVSAASAFLLAYFPVQAQAAECDNNFATSGNILSGTTYKTFADLPEVTADSVYQGAYLSIAKQGFIIQQSDSTARVISALNNSSRPGRAFPLNATIEPSQRGATITLTFATPAGAFSPENAIKDEFCKIVRAAALRQPETARSEPTESPDRVGDRANGRTDTGTGRVCLANACIGMNLEEAAKLHLKPRSARFAGNVNFVGTKDRAGHYGLDSNGKLVAITSLAVDQVWIKQFLETIHTMCVVPPQINAEISASDGSPINLMFGLRRVGGKVEYVLSSISRMIPSNMSALELRNFENEVRQRYGRAFVENRDISRTVRAYNGELEEPVAMISPGFMELRGPGFREPISKLLEQPGCSNKVRLD